MATRTRRSATGTRKRNEPTSIPEEAEFVASEGVATVAEEVTAELTTQAVPMAEAVPTEEPFALTPAEAVEAGVFKNEEPEQESGFAPEEADGGVYGPTREGEERIPGGGTREIDPEVMKRRYRTS